jgi:D-alanyl-D-alanine carboxypeptidase (penicillin-binding protein 5/6)
VQRLSTLIAACCAVLAFVAPASATPAAVAAVRSADPGRALAQADPLPAGAPAVSAAGAALWDPADDRVLYGVEPEVGRPMASLTKIMTVLLALEAGTIDDTVTVSAQAAALGEATLDLRPGQQVPMNSLVAGLLLRSGNDAALAVAEHVAGDQQTFVAQMNARAAELGLDATRFVNPSGLTTDPAHVSSPVDLARLAEVAMAHETFARYAGAAAVTVPGLAPMVSRNELLGVYPGASGVKTGFTSLAGNCLVASATRDGRTLYAVVLDSERSFADATALLDYGFGEFRRAEPVAPGGVATTYRWSGAEVAAVASSGLGMTVPADARVTWRTRVQPSVARPVAAGAPLGTVELMVDGEVVRDAPLVAEAAVAAPQRSRPPAAVAGAALQDALRAFARTAVIERSG